MYVRTSTPLSTPTMRGAASQSAPSRWRSKACTAGVHRPAGRRTVPPILSTAWTLPNRTSPSSKGTLLHSRRAKLSQGAPTCAQSMGADGSNRHHASRIRVVGLRGSGMVLVRRWEPPTARRSRRTSRRGRCRFASRRTTGVPQEELQPGHLARRPSSRVRRNGIRCTTGKDVGARWSTTQPLGGCGSAAGARARIASAYMSARAR
jgi:hypothetical protein